MNTYFFLGNGDQQSRSRTLSFSREDKRHQLGCCTGTPFPERCTLCRAWLSVGVLLPPVASLKKSHWLRPPIDFHLQCLTFYCFCAAFTIFCKTLRWLPRLFILSPKLIIIILDSVPVLKVYRLWMVFRPIFLQPCYFWGYNFAECISHTYFML